MITTKAGLLFFRCDSCGAEEQVFNTRNGKVPTVIPCRGKKCQDVMGHVGVQHDINRVNHVLKPQQRYIVTLTLAEATKQAFAACVRRGSPVASAQDFEAKHKKLTTSFYGAGDEPVVLVHN